MCSMGHLMLSLPSWALLSSASNPTGPSPTGGHNRGRFPSYQTPIIIIILTNKDKAPVTYGVLFHVHDLHISSSI